MGRVKKDVHAGWKGERFVFPNIKAWLCQSCGEEAYEPDDVDWMQRCMREKTRRQP